MNHSNKIFFLVDVNNMYTSVETAFDPSLSGRACVVLSSNDGNIVARSPAAKKLGIKMGEPLFQIQDLIMRNDVIVLSSNYIIYGEMSRRFHKILAEYVSPENHEIYSVDEAFLELTSYRDIYDLNQCAKDIKEKLMKFLSLPVCVGIGRTKTEAKCMNHIAKTYPHLNGICNVFDIAEVKDSIYRNTDVGEVWGVGRQQKKKLQLMNINTIYDLMMAPPSHIQSVFSVVLKRTVLELNGISCIDIEHTPPTKKQIVSSRTFGQRITKIHDLKEAIIKRTQEAFTRARNEQVLVGCLIVFGYSNPFDKTKPFYKKEQSASFAVPTDDLRQLVHTATKMIEQVYKEGIEFKKAGVILTCLEPKHTYTYDLLTDHEDLEKTEQLMIAIENVQKAYGKNKIGFGGSMFKNRIWSLTANHQTRNYFSFEGMIKIMK
ncbi:Y-family DNA polymerase (plasmid) [Acinetobacter baumannii]|uniref:Y-family DNA polymerase n=1 Tax=Acinetobacter baumannii TaxID=470 RepID=UPI00389211AF